MRKENEIIDLVEPEAEPSTAAATTGTTIAAELCLALPSYRARPGLAYSRVGGARPSAANGEWRGTYIVRSS